MNPILLPPSLLFVIAWAVPGLLDAAVPGPVAGPGVAGRPGTVGRYAHAEKIVFEGNKTFTPAVLRQGLLKSTDFLLAAYPSEALEAFLKKLQSCLQRGYAHSGFPEARVTVDFDAAGDVIRARIVEGPRYRWGRLRFEGLKSIDAEAFTREFLQEAVKPDGFARRISHVASMWSFTEMMSGGPALPSSPGAEEDPISVKKLAGDREALTVTAESNVWKAGETASFGPEADGSLRMQIVQRLRWKGVSAREVTITHEWHADRGVADTQVRIEEGPPVVLSAITLKGNETFTREGILKFLGLREGMTVREDILARVEERLARSMRFVRWRGLLVEAKEGIELCLGVQELPGALPLEQALSADQQEFVRLAEWITMMDREDTTLEARVIREDGTPEPESPFRFAWASQKGLQVRVEGPVLGDEVERFALTLMREGVTALLDENKKRTVWHAATPAADVETGMVFATELDEEGKPAGRIHFFSGFRGGSMRESGLKLRAVMMPTEVYRIATGAGGTARRIREAGVECLEIVYNEIRFVWDIPHQELRECRFPLDEASTGKGRRFLQIHPGTEQWRELEAELSRAGPGKEAPAGSFSDWAGLVLRVPDLESMTKGLLTREVVERSALLLDLSSHLLVTLLDVWQESTKSKDAFSVPLELPDDGSPPPMTSIMANLWFMFADAFLPPENWLWELGREAFYAEMGRREGTQAAMQRIAQDPAIGPHGALLAESILNKLYLPEAILFRRLAAQRLSAEHFRKDWETLFRAPVGLQESVDHLFKQLAGFDERQLRLLGGTAGLGLEKPLLEAVARLRSTAGVQPAELLWPVAESWWKTSGQEKFQKRLGPISRLQPPDPAIVAARVNDTDITRQEVQLAAREQEQVIRRSLGDRLADMDRQIAVLHEKTLDQFIQKALMIEAFEKSGGTIKDEFIEKDVDALIAQQFGGDRAAFQKALASEGVTLERFKKMRRDLMIMTYVRSQIVAAVKEPGEAELRAAYDAFIAKNRARQVHLHAITLPKTQEDAPKLARDLHARLVKGEDFEQLAKTYSTDENASNGGCRGTLDPTELHKPLQDALQTMKARDVSPVVELEAALVLLWIKDEKPVAPPSFEKERPRLLEEVRRQQQEDLLKSWTDEKRKAAYVEIFPAP